MGLFKKDSPAEKKLKELTGGFLLSTPFINRLEAKNLAIKDGEDIKKQLKKEINEGLVDENNIEIRLNVLINNYSNSMNNTSSKNLAKENTTEKICPRCKQSQDESNRVCIYCGQEFYDMTRHKKCPKCREWQDNDNSFCINCGYDFLHPIKKEKQEKECPHCNHKVYINDKRCIHCGYNFETKKMPKYLKRCPKCDLSQRPENKECCNCKLNLTEIGFIDNNNLIKCSHCKRKIPKESYACPFCKSEVKKEEIPQKTIEPTVEINLNSPEFEEYINKTLFLTNYDYNTKLCSDCDTKLLKTDSFCFNCGSSVITQDSVKTENMEVKEGKLVAKTEKTQNDKLSDLESLYSQTLKSKYTPPFKVCYVLYLEEFRKNPTKKFSDKIARVHETTPTKLKKQALEDEYIELASPLLSAKDFKVTELKEILKEHDLKVSGKKDELIERLGENLTDAELKKHFKSKNYQISNEGLKFLENNNAILYIYNDKDISSVFYPSDITKLFEERKYEKNEIYDILIKYLSDTLDDKLNQELWVDFKHYSNALAQVYEDNSDLKKSLNIRLKVFLFNINNYSIVTKKPEPRKTKLKKKDMMKLTNLLHELSLPIDELKEFFNKSFDETLFKTVISKEDSLIYLLKVFSGEDLNNISREINEYYSNPY